MTQPLGTFGPGNEFESGIYPSVDKLSAPFWHDGENVEFRKGGITSSKGYEELASLNGEVSEMAQAFHEGDQRIYAAVGAGVFMRSSLSGLSSLGSFPTVGVPQFETLGSFLLGTNGVDPIMAWENTGTFDEIPEAAARFSYAKLLHRRSHHILAFNTSNGQTAYEWCSASDIHTWTPAAANSAGQNFLRDLDSEIICVKDIGQQTAVYSRETMAILNFLGQPDVFGAQQAINGVGAVGARSVVQVGAENYGLNRQGVFQTDGISFIYLADPAILDFIQADVDFDNGEAIRGYHNEDLTSVIWYYDKVGGGRAGIGYNYRRPGFRKYTTGVEVALERQVFSTPIAAIDSSLVLLNSSHNSGGAVLSKWVRTKPLSAQDAGFWKYWSHLKLVGNWSATSQVKIGALENPNSDNIEWFSTQYLDYELWFEREAPFLVLEFRADNLDDYFEVSQLQLSGTGAGATSI